MIQLNGIFPPLPTSFDEREDLDARKMQENIQRLNSYDLRGYLILGSNGELVNLTEEERVEVYERTREAIPSDRLMLAGTGCQSTRETIRLSRRAAGAGADAVLVLNPSYYKGLMNQKPLVQHYFAVAEATDVPVIVYNMPANSGLDMDAGTIAAISVHDNIIGMKDSGGNLVKMGDVRRGVKPDFQILAGSASFLLPALSVGAIGGVLALANIAPAQCIQIYQNFLEGKMEEARTLQLDMIPVNTAVTRQWGVPALKEAMDQLGLYGGPSRKPLLPVDQEIKDQLADLLNQNDIHF